MKNDFPRLSRVERVILTLLADGEMFGLELVDESDGALKRGTVYVTLSRMQDKGLVTSRTESPAPGAIGLPRRLYSATAYGIRTLEALQTAARAVTRLRPRHI